MSDEQAVTVVEPKQEKSSEVERPDLALAEWGSRNDISVLASRLKNLLPGGSAMSNECAMALAQYSIATDANPFRGEIYAYEKEENGKKKIVLVEGYKLLVRWAKQTAPYTESYEPIDPTELSNGDIGFTCYILRNDSLPTLKCFIEAGANFNEARKLVSHSSVGIVRRNEMFTKDGKPIQPPKGWTWEKVAMKRALKNALNLSHGAPSPKQIAAMSWIAGGQVTIESDWEQVNEELGRKPMNYEEAEATAKAIARGREYLQARMEEEEAIGPDDVRKLRGERRAAASSELYGPDDENWGL